jgi:hypothetical protein
MGARPGDEHLGEPLGNVWFIATVAVKCLGVEVTFPISGDVDIRDPTRRGHQVACVVAVAIPFALGATLSPSRSNELVEFFTHHGFYHDANGTLS